MSILSLAAMAACADNESQPVGASGPPAPERPAAAVTAYTRVVGDDWSGYTSKTQLQAANLFWWYRAENVYDDVDLVPDATFGQVVRLRFRQSDETGFAPKMRKMFPQTLDHIWYRWRIRYTPGWTTVGPNPAGYANSWKMSFWTWEGYGGRGAIQLSNGSQNIMEWNVQDRATGQFYSYAETPLPGSVGQPLGDVAPAWQDNEWYEYVIHYNRISATQGRQEYWYRRLTNGGVIANNPWLYAGQTMTGSPMPRPNGIELGVNKNKSNPTTMYLMWGPWEVVDGNQYPNPFGMPNQGSTTPTITRLVLNPQAAAAATGGTVQFSAAHQMSDGTLQPVTPGYTATGGTISASGLYTAGTTAGSYTVIASLGGRADTSTVTLSSPLSATQLILTPASASLQPGQTAQFSASLRMSDGSSQAVTPIYSATGGTISASGLYTAGATTGAFRVIATAQGRADTAAVTIGSTVTLAQVILTPASVSLQTGGTAQFTASGRMSDGTTRSVTVTYAASGGTITSGGLYTAGQTAGAFRVIATAQGSTRADTSTVTISAPSAGYTAMIRDDWRGYAAGTTPAGFSDPSLVALTSDPVFGQVVRITQPAGSTASPRMTRALPAPTAKVWYRFRYRFSPGWTTNGAGSGSALYGLAELGWSGYGGDNEIQLVGSTYGARLRVMNGSTNVSYAESVLPGSGSLGNASAEFTSGDWWEAVIYYEKTGTTTARQRYWVRRLTSGGVMANNAWSYLGISLSGNTTPTVGTVYLGLARTRAPAATQHLYWGPWEAVDGTRYANPWVMPNL